MAVTARWIIYPASWAGSPPTYDISTGWSSISGSVTGSEVVDDTDTLWTAASLTTGLDPNTEYKLRVTVEDGATVGNYADYSGSFTTAFVALCLTPAGALVRKVAEGGDRVVYLDAGGGFVAAASPPVGGRRVTLLANGQLQAAS